MASKKPKIAALSLASLVAATLANNIVYASPEAAAALVKAGHAEQNASMTNDAGELATRATQAGIEAEQAKSQAAAPAVPKPSFTISKGIPIPEKVRASHGRASIYPFDELEVGDSFFVPGKEASKFGSTLGSARKRSADAEGNPTRNYRAANVNEGGVDGIRVWRVALDA